METLPLYDYAGTDLAAFGQLPVADVHACENSPRGLKRTWRRTGSGAVGGAAVAIHVAIRAPGH